MKVNQIGIFVGLMVLAFLISFGIEKGFQSFEITGMVVGDIPKDSENEVVSEEVVEESPKTCIDSDGGLNYDLKGTVEYCEGENCRSEEDFCVNGKINEWYCENNELALEGFYKCPGICYSGRCKVASGGGSSGGGSSSPSSLGSSAVVENGETHELGELGLEHKLEVVKDDEISLDIVGIDYTLTVMSNTAVSVEFLINTGQSFGLGIGEETEIDLDNDGTSEMYIKLSSVNLITGKIEIIIRRI